MVIPSHEKKFFFILLISPGIQKKEEEVFVYNSRQYLSSLISMDA